MTTNYGQRTRKIIEEIREFSQDVRSTKFSDVDINPLQSTGLDRMIALLDAAADIMVIVENYALVWLEEGQTPAPALVADEKVAEDPRA